jgi:hypothetical protein
MRYWAKKLMDNPPPEPKTKKDKILVTLSIIVDATIILLLVYTLMTNSCQICYQTGYGATTFRHCKNVADVMENGLPPEVIDIYEGRDLGGVVYNGSSNSTGDS